MSKVFVSNRFEALLSQLKESLHLEKEPFRRHLVVIPHGGMRREILFSLLDSMDGVAIGVQFLELTSALRYLFRIGTRKKLNLPTLALLSLTLENELVLEGVDRKEAFRRADYLSQAFLRYGKYGGAWLDKWLKKEGEQQRLWKKVFGAWDQPFEILEGTLDPRIDIDLHVFNIPFIPELYQRFLAKVETVWDVTYYQVSPTSVYWGDWTRDEGVLGHLGAFSRQGMRFWENKELVEHYTDEALPPVEFHMVTSKLREVEVVFNVLHPLLKEYQPSEILVLAPDISEYEAFIHLVFAGQLPYQLSGLERRSKLEDFLALDERRWSLDAVFELLPEKYLPVKRWLEEEGLRWGLDEEHRQELLESEVIQEGERGTWSAALKNLAWKVAETSEIQMSEVELLGDLFDFIEKLKREKLELTLEEWTEHFRQFVPEFTGIGQLSDEMRFPLESVKRHFLTALSRKTGSYQASEYAAVRFANLEVGVATSAKVVCLLGQHEGAFPRQSIEWSEDEMGMEGDLCPSKADEDRYALLEALLATRDQMHVTFVEAPSSPIKLLMDKLEVESVVHPPFSFHRAGVMEARSPKMAKMAKSFYSENKFKPFVPEFFEGKLGERSLVEEIEVRALTKLMKNPLRFYFNEVLRCYLKEPEAEGGEFVLSPLDAAIASRGNLSEGKWPLGFFADLAKDRAEQKEFARYELHPYVDEPMELEDRLVVPAIEIEGVKVVGQFDYAGGGGKKLADWMKVWVPKVIVNCLGFENALVKPEKALGHLVNYYRLAINQVSPLYPEWLEAFMKGPDELKKAIERTVKSTMYLDRYVAHFFGSPRMYDVRSLYQTWESEMRLIVTSMQEALDGAV
ncbi:MAG: RecBCD enzyme subunit RecC [Chlamydiia bacterium]|nr:RecBCD enzyme subunit RecC [Chlamydiia bacterium]MCH9616369.1 RecBCD enzyme subunit RecC [Chlamydiia bacterium]MCH9629645.1 RecBCD enzyme subunit RecC [Chlamydiia bacterium]